MDGPRTSKRQNVETSKLRKDSHFAMRAANFGSRELFGWAKLVLLVLAGIVVVCGCATPGGAKQGDAKQLSPAAKKAEEQKQENLTEVEDFLARTQQYAQPDAPKSAPPQPQSIRDFLDSVDKSHVASANQSPQPKIQPAAAPSDQIVAN